MICLRSYRKGYGETRAVEVIRIERPTFQEKPIEIKSPGPPPTGMALAELINASDPIASSHAGHMVVVISNDAADVVANRQP